MKKLYSIGETAKIMGISVQTLRNYSKFSFLQPAYINEENGYRYYTFNQFHIIDRIKYLRTFGLSLNEIQKIMSDGKQVNQIVTFLENRSKMIDQEIQNLQMTNQDINWYIEYFKHINQAPVNTLPHVTHFDKRYIIHTDCSSTETLEDIEVRLATIKNDYGNQYQFHFHRQFGYLLDYNALLKHEWEPSHYFIYLSTSDYALIEQKNLVKTKDFMELPAGDYLCFSFRLRHMDDLNINLIKEYFSALNAPPWIIANEHEDNLISYTYCPYELQFLLTT